jgi:hypothetical protein
MTPFFKFDEGEGTYSFEQYSPFSVQMAEVQNESDLRFLYPDFNWPPFLNGLG